MSQAENQRSSYRVGGIAAFLAAISLIVTFTAFGMAGAMGGESAEALLRQIYEKRLVFTTAYVAVTLISLFDIFTVPALYLFSKKGSQPFALSGAILAVIGDILGLTSGVIQMTLLRLSVSFVMASGAEQTAVLMNSQLVESFELVLSKAGFLLVGPSFLFFGLAMLMGNLSKWIGWVGIVAGILTLLGLVPSLMILSLGANILYLAWYVGIGIKFLKSARQSKGG